MLVHESRSIEFLFQSESHTFGCVLFSEAVLAGVNPAPGRSAPNASVSACSDTRSTQKP